STAPPWTGGYLSEGRAGRDRLEPARRQYPCRPVRFLFWGCRPCPRRRAFGRAGRLRHRRRRQPVVDLDGPVELCGLIQRALPCDMGQRLRLDPKLIGVFGKTLVERGRLLDAPATAHRLTSWPGYPRTNHTEVSAFLRFLFRIFAGVRTWRRRDNPGGTNDG